MELRQLKGFYEVARTKNVSLAAGNLHLSQPALSISIKKLEEELGLSLFVREGRSLVFTDEGRRILPLVEKMISYETEIMEVCRDSERKACELKIKVKAAQPFISNVISQFHHDYPDINIILMYRGSGDETPDIIIDAQAANPYEYISADEGGRAGHRDVVFMEEIVIALPRILCPVKPRSMGLDEILDYQLIGINRDYSLGIIEDYYSKLYGLNLRHSIICDNPSVMTSLLSSGTGIAFVPAKTWMLQNNPSINLIPPETGRWVRYLRAGPTAFRDNRDTVDAFLGYIGRAAEKIGMQKLVR